MDEMKTPTEARPSAKAMELAAQCWCDPETSGLEMDLRLATAFAKRFEAIQKESFDQQQGSLLWIAAMVDKAGGHVILYKHDQLRAMTLELERGDAPDGTTFLRVSEPPPAIVLQPTEIQQATTRIILSS